MSLSRDSRQKRLWKAYRRAQWGYKLRALTINWEEDELFPELAALDAGKSVLGLPPGSLFQLEITGEDTTQGTTTATEGEVLGDSTDSKADGEEPPGAGS